MTHNMSSFSRTTLSKTLLSTMLCLMLHFCLVSLNTKRLVVQNISNLVLKFLLVHDNDSMIDYGYFASK